MKFELGQRVMTVNHIERYPDFQVPIMRWGTVTTIEGDPEEPNMLGVTMDEPIPGCEQWNNEVQWNLEVHGRAKDDLLVEVMDPNIYSDIVRAVYR